MTNYIKCITDNPVSKAINDTCSVGIFAIDTGGYYVYSNPAFQRMLGLSEEQIINTKWEMHIQQQDRDRVVSGVLLAIADGTTYGAGAMFMNAAKNIIQTTINVTPVRSDDKIVGCICTVDDEMGYKKKYEELKQKNNTLQSLIENTTASIFSFDKNLNYTAFNNAHSQHVKRGRNADIKVGDNYLELATANTGVDREKTLTLFNRVMAGEQVESIEEFGEPGMYRAWFSMICCPMRDEDGSIMGMSVFCQDITERVQLQEEIDLRTNTMQAIVDNTSAVLYSLDGDGNCTAFNKAAKDALKKARGIDLEIGDNYPEIAGANSKDKANILHFIKRAMAGERDKFIQEFGDPGKYRTFYSVNTNPIEDSNGKITGMVVCSHDVTDYMRLQKENDAQTRLINRLLAHMPIAIYKIGPDDVITLSVGAALKSVGLTDNEAVGKSVYETVPHLADNIHRGMAGDLQDFIIYNPARNVYFHHYIFPDDDVKGGIIGFSIDITKNKLAENEILQNQLKIEQQATTLKELNDFKNKIFSIISHDLRSPINNLMSMASLFDEGLLTVDEMKSLVREIRSDSEQVQNVLDNLLKWSLLQAGMSRVPENIAAKLFFQGHLNMYKFLAGKKHLRTLILCDDDVVLAADKNQLSLVVRNLIDNAIKFTPLEGAVTIGVKKKDHCYTVYVSNSGAGMTKDTIARILSSRYMNSTLGTANEKGMGLGLQLCKEFIRSMGSALQIESDDNGLITFYFDIPA